MELECVFFSVTPTLSSRSRITLLLTSSSLARSLIRTFCCIPPCFLRFVPSAYAFIRILTLYFVGRRSDRAPGCPKGARRNIWDREPSNLPLLAGQLFVRHIFAFDNGALVDVDLRLVGGWSVLHAIHHFGFVELAFLDQLFHRLVGIHGFFRQSGQVSRLRLSVGSALFSIERDFFTFNRGFARSEEHTSELH